MKVLQHPPSEENWFIKAYCTGFGHGERGCSARLKIFREDLRYKPASEDEVSRVTFKCICCGILTDIGMQDYPPHHKDLKPYKKKWLKNDTDS